MANLREHNITPNFLQENSRRISLLAKFILFKAAFPNSILYNYTASRIADLGRLPFGKGVISRAIKQFIELGWAEYKDGHIRLISKWEQAGKYTNKENYWVLKFKSDLSQKDIERQLRLLVLSTKSRQQAWNQKSNQNQSSRRLRRLVKTDEPTNEFQASYATLGDTFGCSISRAKQLVDDLISQKLLFKQTQLTKVCNLPASAWKSVRDSRFKGHFWYNGMVFCQESNRYALA